MTETANTDPSHTIRLPIEEHARRRGTSLLEHISPSADLSEKRLKIRFIGKYGGTSHYICETDGNRTAEEIAYDTVSYGSITVRLPADGDTAPQITREDIRRSIPENFLGHVTAADDPSVVQPTAKRHGDRWDFRVPLYKKKISHQ